MDRVSVSVILEHMIQCFKSDVKRVIALLSSRNLKLGLIKPSRVGSIVKRQGVNPDIFEVGVKP